jgi:hypothetical protein
VPDLSPLEPVPDRDEVTFIWFPDVITLLISDTMLAEILGLGMGLPERTPPDPYTDLELVASSESEVFGLGLGPIDVTKPVLNPVA